MVADFSNDFERLTCKMERRETVSYSACNFTKVTRDLYKQALSSNLIQD